MNEKILNTQRDFQQLLKNDTSSQEFINTCAMGMIEEIVESLKETPFKQHKKNQHFNKENFVKELVDVQLYLLNMLIACDVSIDEFNELLTKKQSINFDRQKRGY